MAIWRRLSLRDSLVLGFCGGFIFAAKALLRLHLHVTGHSMFFNVLFMVIGRGAVGKTGAATLVGLVAGLLAMLTGMGKGGPLILLRYLLVGVVIDLAALVYRGLPRSLVACLVAGGLAGATRGLWLLIADRMAGMEWAVILPHVLANSGANLAFGAAGGLLGAMVVRRLQSRQAL